VPAYAPRSSADLDLRAIGRSLRDDAAADDVLRAVVAHLASVRANLRLTVRALVRKGLMAATPIPLETLPPRALTLLHSHLLLQEAVFAIVKKSVSMGGDASSASTSAIISRRLLDLDASLADQIDSGLMCHLTPIESMYGVLSRGSLGAYVATL
jgi:hypothetical protein